MRALLAATDAATRDTMSDALVSVGCEVTVVDEMQGALDAITQAAPDIVVAGDVRDAGALDVCRRVRALLADAPIVLALARDGAGVAALLDAGADDYLLASPDMPALAARAAARARIATKRVDECTARRRAEGSLARTQRLLGIDDASAGLQHEINNPLAALLAHATLLEHGLHEPGEEKELLGVIVEQAHRIGDVVRRIAALRYPDDGPEFIPDEPTSE